MSRKTRLWMVNPTGLEGKVLIVWAKEPVHGGVIEKARVKRLGSRDFLVGLIPDPKDGQPHPQVGKTVWYPIDNIIYIMQCDNAEEARNYYKEQPVK